MKTFEHNPSRKVASRSAVTRARRRQDSPNRPPAQGAAQNINSVPGSVSNWIARINRVWTRGAVSTLDLAKVVSAAKARLHHGQWSLLLKSGQMPFSKSTIDRLAMIGQGMGGLDSATSPNLPRAWNILYCLARLDPGTLEPLIRRGAVHPELTLRQAKELVAQHEGGRNAARPARFNVRQRLEKFAEFVHTTLNSWTPEERAGARDGLREILRQVEGGGNLFASPEVQLALADCSCTDPINSNSFASQRSA